MLIDTHVHYNLEPLFSNNEDWDSEEIISPLHWKTHWQNSQKNNIEKSIVVGTNVSTSFRAIQIAMTDPHLFATVGLHPTEVGQFAQKIINGESEKNIIETLDAEINKIENLTKYRQIVAIGEIGLDYYRLANDSNTNDKIIELQKYVFLEQLNIAQKSSFPVVCHIRDKDDRAYYDALKILKKIKPVKFVLHCVSGPIDYVKSSLKLDAYLGFDGNITYPNAQHIREIFKLAPKNKVLLETDAPFLPPQDFRGKTCEPWMLVKTANFISQELKFEAEQTAENTEELFELKK